MIISSVPVTSIVDLDVTSRNKTIEVKVYRKWVSTSVSGPTSVGICCILIDREGGAIQANMNVRDLSYFDTMLEKDKAYRISNLRCEATKKFNQTLDNVTSLSFGNYIRCVQRVGDLIRSGNHNTKRTIRRVIEVENVNGNCIERTIWSDMETGFDVRLYEVMEKPVIIVVSSCRVSDYGGVQYKEWVDLARPLAVEMERVDDRDTERMRNIVALATLLEPLAILSGISEQSLAPTNVTISKMCDPTKVAMLKSVPTVSATKFLKMSLSKHLAKDSCSSKITVLTSYTPYPSRKIYGVSVPSLHKRPRRNKVQYACMTKSSTKELLTPLKEPEQEFRSSRKLFKTLSLDESRSPKYNLFSDLEEDFEKEVAEIMTETTDQYEVILFYNGSDVPTRQILDSKGVMPTKTAADAKIRNTETSDGLAAIQAQLNNLGREIKMVNEKVYAAQVGCEQCKGPHYTKYCPLKEEGKTVEEAYYTQFDAPFQQGGQYKAAALGFYQRNNVNPSYQERRQSMEESLSKFMSESTKRHEENSNLINKSQASTNAAIRNQGDSIKTLEIQIGQMSNVLQERGFGSLPSSTETTLRDHVMSISTTVKANMTSIRRIGSSEYAISAQQNSKLMFESRRKTILFPSRLNDCYCDKKKGSYGLQCLDAYFFRAIVVENMDGYRDQDMGDVIFGEPFCKASCVEARRFDGLITIHNGNDNVTYQMARSHPRFKHLSNAQCNKIMPLLKVFLYGDLAGKEIDKVVIMEYLVKISKKARILELKRRHLKITVLTSYTPYPSRKIRRICACTSQETTKIQSPIRRIQENSIRRIQYKIELIRGSRLKRITSITVNGKAAYELKGNFLDDLRDNAFSRTNGEEAIEHIKYFLKTVDPINFPNVNYERIRLVVFLISLVRNASKWFDEFKANNDDEQEITEIFKIETNLFNYETSMCTEFKEFSYLLKVDPKLFTHDIERTKTYEDYENELNDELEEPWCKDGVPYEICDHIYEPFHFKNGKTKWATYSSNDDGFCNGGELPGMVRVGYIMYFQDYEWYNDLIDSSLTDEAMKQKAIYEKSWGNASQSVINFCAGLK
ncbi:hypothetical protein Tco_0545342, partial [Tanacetum coccineum]